MAGRFVDATGTDPEVLKAIRCRSPATEADFVAANLVLLCTRQQLVVCDLLTLGPSVRYDGIRRRGFVVERNQLEVAAR
jgi:hypothetical protein